MNANVNLEAAVGVMAGSRVALLLLGAFFLHVVEPRTCDTAGAC